MKEKLVDLLEASASTLSLQQIALHLFASIILGLVIYLSYYISHEGTIYSKKFNISLLMLTVLTTIVMTVIGNNIALSLGMVGALSIVRFRTAIKDSRDTAYIFWTVVVGICCGVGDHVVAGLGSAAIFLIMLILGRVQNDNRILIIIRAGLNNEMKIEGIIYDYFKNKANLRTKNTTPDSIELIYEVPKNYYVKSLENKNILTKTLYNLKNVDYVNIVSQNDEISG